MIATIDNSLDVRRKVNKKSDRKTWKKEIGKKFRKGRNQRLLAESPLK